MDCLVVTKIVIKSQIILLAHLTMAEEDIENPTTTDLTDHHLIMRNHIDHLGLIDPHDLIRNHIVHNDRMMIITVPRIKNPIVLTDQPRNHIVNHIESHTGTILIITQMTLIEILNQLTQNQQFIAQLHSTAQVPIILTVPFVGVQQIWTVMIAKLI